MSLDVVAVSKSFGKVQAVNNIDLNVERGELFALLGPSGCGKTTLLRILAGIYPLDDGRLSLNGRDITNVAMHRRNLAMVFQNYALFPHLNVFENVAFGLRSRKIGGSDLKQRVDAALALVRLQALAQRYPAQLSGGQQQRVSLARAVAVEPELLLLDEPLSNLDARLRDEMRIEIRDLQRRLAITTVFVTHDIGEAFAMADRIAVMRDGRILQIGRAAELYRNPTDPFVANFLGPVNDLRLVAVEGDAAGPVGQLAGGVRVRLPPHASAAAGSRLLVRPECIVVGPTGNPPDNVIDGEVTDLVFLGGSTEVRIRAGEVLLLAILPSAQAAPLRLGQRVRAGWASTEGVLTRDG